MTNLYADGGVIRSNPSPYGGTFAWLLVDENDKRISCDSGVIEPKNVGMLKITNNLSELWAAISALEAMPPNWAGTIWSDSKITCYRLTTSDKFNGIPRDLKYKCLRLRRWAKWKVRHLGGHPTKRELLAGVDGRGLVVSKYNCWCDLRCGEEALRFLRRLGIMSTETVVVNFRQEACDVKITRTPKNKIPDPPQFGCFGNPYPVKIYGREQCLALFRDYFLSRIATDSAFRQAVLELRGKRLGCFCKPLECHGDVIKEWLDRGEV